MASEQVVHDALIPAELDLTLVIDIGKSNAKLLLIDDAGAVVERHSRSNASVPSPLGYPALDLHGLQAWMQSCLCASVHARRCGHAIASTHGAALVALGDEALAWEPLDYEFAAVALPGAVDSAWRAASGPFAETLSPELPAGLNAARQLHWLQNVHPDAWRGTRTLLPYAQYWAWLLCGVAASEVSSLGCHTHLWNPVQARFSTLALSRGWADLFAPLRDAWEVLGTVGARGVGWGLPAACLVHVGVHDSNACLARYIDRHGDPQNAQPLTVVSSGTWTVLMAPGAPAAALQPAHDMLGNVDVTGRMTPTARFMGGREFSVLLDGADPGAATPASLQALLDTHTLAIPSFAPQGGPFAAYTGVVQREGKVLQGAWLQHLGAPGCAALAAVYCAQVTAWLVTTLWQSKLPDSPASPRMDGAPPAPRQGRVLVEGPLTSNPVYLQMLQALLPQCSCWASSDPLEGTARGAWLLAHWRDPAAQTALQPCDAALPPPPALPGLALYQQRWLDAVAALVPTPARSKQRGELPKIGHAPH